MPEPFAAGIADSQNRWGALPAEMWEALAEYRRITATSMVEQPRREERFLLPAITIWIGAIFTVNDLQHHGRLWDISWSGCCLLFPPGERVNASQKGSLLISHPSTNSVIPTAVMVMWVDREAGGTYAGCRFSRRVDFSQTFLRGLMVPHEAVRPPGGRLL
ncbi:MULTISPECIES: PilZ domain-containing protein [unclassified Synechococcus]|uniref:PilZ domain-containing protein n=1 Tax=unclassified Synechococcus TaxID=2626047 RepID=UPI0018CFDBC7|nr:MULTISPECIES: PilZ domain-containing protein [unclassified Synechococcus]MEA5423028.1 PilZ domain-containing protein [Synechococcus sp. CCY9202]QPN59388.1 PilZ domain-containing protein [Synechococcus sp. CBW1002]QPN66119.1 PilZ domain-containing protein [Synechococcus sp. CBW1006]